MPFRDREEHESYGLVGVSRISGSDRNLFGSSIRHKNTMMLRVKRANKERHLNRDWYHANETIVEVEMSPVQYAEMISSPNVGEGIP